MKEQVSVKEHLQQLLAKVVSLKLDLVAHEDVLRDSTFRDPSGNLLDWKTVVEKQRQHLNNIQADSLYYESIASLRHSLPEYDDVILQSQPEISIPILPMLKMLLHLVDYQSTLEQK